MSHPRVIVPRIGVSFEGTRELFALSTSDAIRVRRLVDRAFEQSAVSGATKGQATKQAAGVATRRAKKVSIATRRK